MNDKSLNMQVSDRQSFIFFLESFHQDLLINKEKWTNNTLEDFLEALARYVDEIQGFYDNTGQKLNADIASWKLFSDVMQGAKIYE